MGAGVPTPLDCLQSASSESSRRPNHISRFQVPSDSIFNLGQRLSNSGARLATYTAQGKTAKSRIELGASRPLDDKESKQFDIQSGHRRLVAEPGCDLSVLLTDLKKALEAKTLPTKMQRANTLPFTSVSFGSHQSQAPGGGFNTNPPAIGHRWRFSSVKKTRKAKSFSI